MNDELDLNKLEATIVFKERYLKEDEIVEELEKIKDKLDRLLKIFEKGTD